MCRPEGLPVTDYTAACGTAAGYTGQRPGYRGLADPQLLCDVRDPFALGEVHPQQLPLPGRQLLLHRQGQIHQQTPDLLAVVLLLSLLPQLQAGDIQRVIAAGAVRYGMPHSGGTPCHSSGRCDTPAHGLPPQGHQLPDAPLQTQHLLRVLGRQRPLMQLPDTLADSVGAGGVVVGHFLQGHRTSSFRSPHVPPMYGEKIRRERKNTVDKRAFIW